MTTVDLVPARILIPGDTIIVMRDRKQQREIVVGIIPQEGKMCVRTRSADDSVQTIELSDFDHVEMVNKPPKGAKT
jgi:hypothetical protein